MIGGPIALAVLAAWVPLVLLAFGALGPRRAVPLALLGGFLLLPRWSEVGWTILGAFPLDKRTIPGLAAILAVALFDRPALARLRPGVADLPMLGYLVAPLLAGAANGPGAWRGSAGQAWINLAEWGLPYVVGRAYYGDPAGPRRLAGQLVLAGLATVPVVAFEAILGPDYYLSGRIYGTSSHGAMNSRLGGWRPEGFLSSGLEMAEWMALAAVLAAWMGALARWRPAAIPPWLPGPVLVAGAIACRGVYGYAALATGLAATALTGLLRARPILMVLTLVPPAYIAARASGLWDGRALVGLAGRAGNASTTLVRINMEDDFLGRAGRHGLAFGFGGTYPDWKDFAWAAEGRWVTTMTGAGLVGVALHYSALLVPAALIIWRRPSRGPATSPELGLALFAVLHAIDSLHNYALLPPVPLISGALAGLLVGEGRPGDRGPRRPPVASTGPGHATYRLRDIAPAGTGAVEGRGPIAGVLAIACLLYVFGHAPASGQETMRFVGGLGSALLFASVGAAVAASPSYPPARASAFGLAFAALGISFNLALHASSRPTWSADILQGMALAGVVAACWRRAFGASSLGFAALGAIGASWWAIGPSSRPFPGSQYLFAEGQGGLSPFPVLPWLALTALGAALQRATAALAATWALAFGASAALAWGLGVAPVKFPMNPTYALLGASLASAAFASGRLAWSSRRLRAAAGWLGRRWLVFFYIHMGIAVGLGRAGLTWPVACWTALFALSIAATWAVSEAANLVRPAFRGPAPWVVLGVSTLAVGLVPGVPPAVTLAVAGTLGLAFAALHDELAALILGPPPAEPGPGPDPMDEGATPRYLARVAVVVAVLVAPELVGRLPSPFGTGPGPKPAASVDARGPDGPRAPGPRP